MSVFRKSALDKLSSPEQLDKLIRMTSPRSWMIPAFFILIIASTLIWSVVGTIPKKIQAQGIIMSSNGTESILSTVEGVISDVTIKKDDYVHVGDTIARVSQSAYVDEIEKVEKQIGVIESYTLEAQDTPAEITEDVLALYDVKIQITDLNKQVEKMILNDTTSTILDNVNKNSAIITAYKTDLATKKNETMAAASQLAAAEGLLNDGTITQAEYGQIEAIHDTALTGQNQIQLALAQAEQNQTDLQKQYKMAKLSFQGEVDYLIFRKDILKQNFTVTKSAKLDALSKRLMELKKVVHESEIVSAVEGQILTVYITKGSVVQKGAELAKMQEKGSNVSGTDVVFYVAMEVGKKLIPGMKINVYPTTVNRQEYGHMEAVVTDVSNYAVSVDDMRLKLGNDELIKKFLAAGVLVEVDAIIKKDDTTISGYYWSSIKGKSLSILEGTLCDASITIEQNKPISLLFPFLKENLSPFE